MMTPEELTQAKMQLARYRESLPCSMRTMEAEAVKLLKKYPGLTLSAAQLVDATPPVSGVMLPGQEWHDPGNDFLTIRRQETGPNRFDD